MDKSPADSIVRAQAVALSDAGLSQIQISRQLKISRHCVQDAIKKYNETGQYTDLQRTGCLRKIQNRDIRHLEQLSRGNGCLNAAKIESNLNRSLPKPVTIRTIRHYR